MIRKKLNIGVDIDNVILDEISSLKYIYSKNNIPKKEALPINQIYSLHNVWNSLEEYESRLKEWHNSEEFLNLKPIKGAKKALTRLSRDHDIYLITARSLFLKDRTLENLNSHFKGYYKDVHFTGYGEDTTLSKAEVCKNLGINIFIDDAEENIIEVSSLGIDTLIFDTPWNQNIGKIKNTKRVYSWKEIEEYINS
ncbi:MAG: 5' nucleotidase, NT5C type [Patescibacteria group bacterium]